jgi:hypothetical protein
MKAGRITKELELDLKLKYMQGRVEGVRKKQTDQYFAIRSMDKYFTQAQHKSYREWL